MTAVAAVALLGVGVVLVAVGLWLLHPGLLLIVAGAVCWSVGGQLLE